MTLPQFPDYTDVSLIGSGGFADVYRARHVALDRAVAIKLFRVTLDDPAAARRFTEECAALMRLEREDEVLHVHDARTLPDRRPYLISELCSRSLAELADQRGGSLPVTEVTSVGRRMAKALAAAHFARVLHGDVTPQNVLFRPGGDAVLADFGLAVLRDHRGNTAAGFTPAHAAPETVRADGAFAPRTDVYGLGSTLVTALTGAPPFPLRVGENDAARALRILTEPAPRVTAAPPWLADLLAAMLAKDVEQRPTAAEVVAALDAGATQHAGAGRGSGGPVPGERSAAVGPAFAPPPGMAPAAGGSYGTGTGSEPLTRGRAGAPVPSPPDGHAPGTDAPDRTRMRADSPRRPDDPAPARRRLPRPALLAAAALVVLLIGGGAAGFLAMNGGAPDTPAAAPAPAAPGVPGSAVIELAPPQDAGDSVTLTWTADSELSYGVYVAEEGAPPPQPSLTGRGTSVTVPVEPGLRYCFLVQGSDPAGRVSQSNVQSLRGAICRF